MEQMPFVILALFFIAIALSVVFFMAWRAFGRERHVLLWSIAFGVSAIQWALNLGHIFGWITSYVFYWVAANFAGSVVPNLAVAGYLHRAGRHVYIPFIAGIVLLTTGGSAWFAFIQPHVGLQVAIQPYSTALVSIWVVWILLNVQRPKRPFEWGGAIAYSLFSVVCIVIGSIALSQGATVDADIMNLYRLVLFLSLPTFFTLLGLLALSIVASDLAKKAQDLASYQRQKRQEEAERSWGTLQDAIEAISDLVAIDDGRGNMLTCNETFARFLNLSRDDFAGKRTTEMMELYKERFRTINGKEVHTGAEIAQLCWHALTTGERLNVVTNDDQSYIVDCGYLRSGGQIMVARDVTQLHRTRARLETAINTMPIGFSLFDRNNQLVACNRTYEDMIGKDAAWIADAPMDKVLSVFLRRLERFKGESLVLRAEWLQNTLENIENRRKLNDVFLLDNQRWYDISVQPIGDGGFVTIASDITERRLLELDLERNEAQLREILGAQPFPVVVVRQSDDRILFASKAARDVLRIDQDEDCEAAALFWHDFADQKRRKSRVDSDQLEELILRRRGGERFPALFSRHLISFAGVEARVKSFIDISNIKELQSELANQREALFQSEKLNALGTLLAGVAHELNNPLTVVVANAHVLGLTVEDPEAQKRLEKITDAADTCSKIIRSFLNMARKNPSKTVLFDIAECVEHALDISSFGLREHHISIEADLAPGLPAVSGDPDQFAQVVLNLIINAKQALLDADAPRTIRVLVEPGADDAAVELHVIDSGPGVPETIRDRIFEPFFTTKGVGQGTGMGLSLVRAIVDSHRGRIDLMDDPDSGAHFRISLPHTGVPLLKANSPDGKERRGPERRILVVDDDPDVLEALADILKLQGHEVVAVGSGQDALDALEEYDFDIMFSDLRMPQMDGEQLFQAVRERYPQMVGRVAFITGNNMSEQARRFLETSGRPSLGKPFLPGDVARLVGEMRPGGKAGRRLA